MVSRNRPGLAVTDGPRKQDDECSCLDLAVGVKICTYRTGHMVVLSAKRLLC